MLLNAIYLIFVTVVFKCNSFLLSVCLKVHFICNIIPPCMFTVFRVTSDIWAWVTSTGIHEALREKLKLRKRLSTRLKQN